MSENNPFFPNTKTVLKPAFYTPFVPYGWKAVSTFIGLPATKKTTKKPTTTATAPTYKKKVNKHSLSAEKIAEAVEDYKPKVNPLKKYFLLSVVCSLVLVGFLFFNLKKSK